VTSLDKPEHLFLLFFPWFMSFRLQNSSGGCQILDGLRITGWCDWLTSHWARSGVRCRLLSSPSNKRLELMDIWPSAHSYTSVHQDQYVCQALFKGKVHPDDDSSAILYSPSCHCKHSWLFPTARNIVLTLSLFRNLSLKSVGNDE